MKSLFRSVIYGVFCLYGFSVFSQDVQQGVIRVKFKPSYVDQVNRQALPNGKFGLSEADIVSGQIGVKSIKRVFREAGKFEKAHRQFGLHLWYEITFDKNTSVSTALKSYGNLPQFDIVESVKPYYAVEPVNVKVQSSPVQSSLSGPTNDPQFNLQWHYQNTGQSGGAVGADISLPQAWAIQTGSPNVIVAVIDGGIDVAHPDLTASMWINDDEIAGNSIDDDGNGYVDDIYGYGFGDNTGTIYPHYHGTHVGGTIAAVTNNSIGVSGIAGGSGTGNGVKLMSLAGFGSVGVGGFEDAMVYAADNGAVISQNSWGGGGQSIEAGIDYFVARAGLDNTDANFDDNIQIGPMAGGIVIFAAGNSNTDNTSIGYPASYAPVVAVASTDHNDVKSYFSNYGSWVDISAPGSNVYSTYPVDLGGYAYLSGTSMACPHVSGVAALIISEFHAEGFVPGQVWDRLQMTADDIDHLNPSFEDKLGDGRVNAFQALQTDDDIPPASIADLSPVEEKLNSVILEWTAPGASGTDGVASYYEIRYSNSPITAANFGAATLVSNSPKPKPAGSTETHEVKGLVHNSVYYFALKARDFFGNTSTISNIVSATTLMPPVIGVTPSFLEEDLFTGASVTRNLTVENTGVSSLFMEISSVKNSSPASSVAAGYARRMASPAVIELKNAPQNQKADHRSISKTYPAMPSRQPEIKSSPSLGLVRPAPATSAGRLFVLNHNTGQIQELNTSSGSVIKNIAPPEPLSGGPDGLAFDGTYVYYVSGWGSNDIHKIDAETGALVSSLNLSGLPYIDGLAHSGEFLYATDYSSGVIYEINFDEGEIVRTIDPPISIAGGISFGGSRGTIFVSNFSSGIYEINLETGAIENTLPSPGTVYGLGYSEALGVLFVSNVSTYTADAIDPDSGEVLFSLTGVLSAAMGSDEGGNNWLSPDRSITVVEPGESVIIPVLLDADGLNSGTYEGEVIITSNDPVSPIVEIPVTLNVTGAPNIETEEASIDFGIGYVSATDTYALEVKNTGTDVLHVSGFSVSALPFMVTSAALSIDPGESEEIVISFSPTSVGTYSGTFTIVSDDPDVGSLALPIHAEAKLPPDIGVSPASITETLFTGENTTKQLTVSNAGSTALTWTLSIETAIETESVQGNSQSFEPPHTDVVGINNTNEQVSSVLSGGPFMLAAGDFVSRANSPVRLTCIATDAATGKIYGQENAGTGFYQYDPYTNTWTTLASSPLYSGNNGGAVYLNGKIYVMYIENSSTMAIYNVAANSWSTTSNAMLAGTANITTDGTYVYAVTGQIFKKYDPAANTWTALAAPPFNFQPWGGLSHKNQTLYGHQGNGYSGFAKYHIATDSWDVLPNVPGGTVLGSAIDPVANMYYTYGNYNGTNFYAYAIDENEWSVTSIPLFAIHDGGMAYVGRPGVSGVYFVQGENGTGFGMFESSLSWISTSISSGSVAAGEDEVIDVVLDAEGLLGGSYNATLRIESDDPFTPEIDVPVSLTVTGAANIEASHIAIEFPAVPVASTLDTVLVITNTGTDNLVVSVAESDASAFTINATSFTLEPQSEKQIVVRFKPEVVGAIAGSLTFHTNDPNAEEFVIALSGAGVLPSSINLAPGSYSLSLQTAESVVEALTIGNDGGSPLTYQLSFVPDVIAPSSMPARLFEQKLQPSYGTNNQLQPVHSAVPANVFPLAAGDFTQKSNSPAPLTCVTVDPATGKLYAQADQGYGFYSYSPQSNSWTELTSAPFHSGNNGGATVLNGKVYTVTTNNPATIGVYTIATNTWTTLPNGLAAGTANITNDGTSLYLTRDYSFKKYNPGTNQWTDLPAPPMQFTQWGGLAYDAPFVFGHQGNSLTGFVKFNTATNVWTTLPSIPGGAVLGAAIDPSAGKYYAYGSYSGTNWYAFDIAANSWSVVTIPFFSVSDGGIAFIGTPGVSGVYFVQGESNLGFARFETDPFSSWLSLSSHEGTLAANEDDEIDVTVDASGLPGGIYTGTIKVLSNDPANPESSVAVTLTVTGVADIAVAPPEINFESYYIGSVADSIIVISNEGSEDLIISSVASSHPRFVVKEDPFTVSPGSQHSLNVRFIPNVVGNHAGAITLLTNDPDKGTVVIPLQGVGVKPTFTVSPNAVLISQPAGTQSSRELTIANESTSGMTWTLAVQGQGELSLEDVLAKLQESHTSITAKIPSRFDFSEGTSGPGINDGGNDMYDGGNYLSTSASSDYLHYTNGNITEKLDFGLEGRYFTAKYPGLFVLAADAEITSFTIDGDLGADNAGAVDGTELTSYQNGKVYKGFVKRVYNTSDPSVNHIVIVENNGAVSQTYSFNTNSDFHKIENLNGVSRIYYLLFAGTGGHYISNAGMQQVMDAFLALVGTSPEWLSISKASGSIAVDRDERVTVNVNTNDLDEGTYHASLVARNGNPAHLPFVVPVSLTVGTAPDIESDKTRIDFESIFSGQSKEGSVTVKNSGTESLVIASITSTNAAFTVSPTSATLAPGESVALDVDFSSPSAGSYSGFLKLESNDPDEGLLLVDLSGVVTSPPAALITPDNRSFTVYRGKTKQISFTLKNTGGMTMTWSMTGLPAWASLDLASGTIAAGQEQGLMLTIDAATLTAGDHTLPVTLSYNHPVTPTQPIAFEIKVLQNHLPELVSNIPAQTIIIDSEKTFELAPYFTDDDGDVLTYYVDQFSQTNIVATVQNSTLKLKGLAVGSGTLSVLVVDAAGDFITTTMSYTVRPLNAPPTVAAIIPDQVLEVGQAPVSINLAEYFRDEDVNDVLRYAVISTETSVVTVSMIGSVLQITPVSFGSVTLTASAEDNVGQKAQLSIGVRVDLPTGLSDGNVLTEISCSPNPFTGTITFDYALSRAGNVRLVIIDLTGRVQETIIDSHEPAGRKSHTFDGSKMNSGMYFYRLEFEGEAIVTKKLVRK